MINLPCACKGCSDRHSGCHATCGKYADYVARGDAIRGANKARKEVEDYVAGRAVDSIRRGIKYRMKLPK